MLWSHDLASIHAEEDAGICGGERASAGNENIPAPVRTQPDSWIVVRCPLCGEIRQYLPSEIFRDKPTPPHPSLPYVEVVRKPVSKLP